jgi:hypothetical protein
MKEKKEPVLCYVTEGWAYFTTQDLDKQWGDDWDDAPMEHNAEEPYKCHEDKELWTITKVAWEGDFILPYDGYVNSPWSVESVNEGGIAWLRSSPYKQIKKNIFAGTTLSDFKKSIKFAGGKTYSEDKR